MNILFINANLQGHINPTLGLVKKLTERGNTVNYFCSKPFAEQVTKMGAKWIGFSNRLDLYLKEYHPTDRHPFFMLMEAMLSYDEVVLLEILNLIKMDRYDIIICDSYFGAGCFLKEITSIPIVCSHSSFAMSHTPVPSRMLEPGYHSQLGEIPPNFLIKSFLPQLEILRRSDLFITHAGFNSVTEALYFGVPMLALPQVNDQHMVAKRLSLLQLGLTESMEGLSPKKLKSITEILTTDSKMKENCMKIAQEMVELTKIELAVAKLEEYISNGKGGVSDGN